MKNKEQKLKFEEIIKVEVDDIEKFLKDKNKNLIGRDLLLVLIGSLISFFSVLTSDHFRESKEKKSKRIFNQYEFNDKLSEQLYSELSIRWRCYQFYRNDDTDKMEIVRDKFFDILDKSELVATQNKNSIYRYFSQNDAELFENRLDKLNIDIDSFHKNILSYINTSNDSISQIIKNQYTPLKNEIDTFIHLLNSEIVHQENKL